MIVHFTKQRMHFKYSYVDRSTALNSPISPIPQAAMTTGSLFHAFFKNLPTKERNEKIGVEE